MTSKATFLISVVLAAFGAARAATYTYGTDPASGGKMLTVAVADGATDTFDATYKAALTDNEVVAFEKIGTGELVMDQDIHTYTGELYVAEGRYVYTKTYNAGTTKSPKYWAGGVGALTAVAGAVHVSSGATLEARVTTATSLDAKRVLIAGSGVGSETAVQAFGSYAAGSVFNGLSGALDFSGTTDSDSVNHTLWGIGITLENDATLLFNRYFSGLHWTRLQCYDTTVSAPDPWLYMNGHTLTIRGGLGAGTTGVRMKGVVVDSTNPGDFVIRSVTSDGVTPELASAGLYLNVMDNFLPEDPSKKFTFKDSATFYGTSMCGRYPYTLVWDSSASFRWEGTGHFDKSKGVKYDWYAATNVFAWHGPVVLKQDLKLQTWTEDSHLLGPVSGEHKISHETYSDKSSSSYGALHLWNAANSFTGGVDMFASTNKTLVVHASGALPTAGGALTMGNCAYFKSEAREAVELPDLVVTGKYESVVAKGQGAWKNVSVVDDDATLVYRSAIGAKTLDIRNGRVKVTTTDRTPYAGLVYGRIGTGTDSTTDPSGSCQLVTESRVCYSDEVVDGTFMAYITPRYGDYWTEVAYPFISVKGYVWNDSDKTETWSVIMNNGNWARLYIDDIPFDQRTYNVASITNFVITPGAHRFEYRCGVNHDSINDLISFSAGSSVSNRVSGGKSVTLKGKTANFALGFDRQGRLSTNQYDYQPFMDPGDGSLFTWALPGTASQHPIDGGALPPSYPTFETVKISEGATLEIASGAVMAAGTVDDIETFEGSGQLVINGTVSVSLADVIAGKKRITTAGSISFAADSKIVLADAATVRPTSEVSYEVFAADGGVYGTPDIVSGTGTDGWSVRYQDGKFRLRFRPKGLVTVYE